MKVDSEMLVFYGLIFIATVILVAVALLAMSGWKRLVVSRLGRRFTFVLNFKRPYWPLLFVSLGFVGVSYASFVFCRPRDQFLLMLGCSLLMMLGAIGFAASLLWMLIEGIISTVRSHPQKH